MGFMDEYYKVVGSDAPTTKSGGNSGGSGGFMDEYYKTVGSGSNSQASMKSFGTVHSFDAPLSERFTFKNRKKKKEEEEEKKRRWFEKGAFEDGYQFGDVSKTILGTLTDAGEHLVSGAIGIGENLLDTGAMLAPYLAKTQALESGAYYNPELAKAHEEAFEESKKSAAEFVARDLYDEEKVAKAIIDPVEGLLDIDSERDSIFGEKSDALVQSAGQLAAQYGLSMIGVPWFLTAGVSSFGSEAENALNQGASFEEAGLSGMISAGAEILSEKLFGGDVFTGSTGSDLATTVLSRSISNKALRSLLRIAGDTAGEGLEEIGSQFFSNLGTSLYREENLGEILFSEQALDEYLESFIGGSVLGGFMTGVNAVKSKSSDTDYVSGLSANEETVVRQVYENRVAEAEKNGDKLSSNQKNKIWESVISYMDKGYISTDDIESILGGESYKNYQKMMDTDKGVLDEYEALGLKQNPNLRDQQRYAELTPKVKSMLDWHSQVKSQLSGEVSELVRGSRLGESYNERARRGETFTADISQYDTAQQAVVQKAIDSGILNNTNRTHEFVDFVAKISADKGVLFDFTNNAKLKDSGFAVDGKQVNGYYESKTKTVGLNIDSAKAMETTVGHEITHVLEGTELYDSLKQTIFDYAKAKGDYQGRYDSLAELYKNVKDADIEKELAADLVGDYLFSDTDFITNLSTQNRNVFQKIYDEVKYLCKVVTAGSKEARELERVKKAFAQAYRDGKNSHTDTKYSLSDSDGKQLTTEQQEYFRDSKMRDENGNLKVMYHGSQDAGFHVFNPEKSDDGTSFFFVDRNDVAASYSGTTESYEARTIRTAEDMNNFLAEIGYDQYEAVEKDGKFELLEDGEHVATSDTAQGIYEEFCWYEGVGEGDANYKVYLNLTNPLVVDAKGRPWNKIDAEFSQEIYDKFQSLTAEEKAALVDLAEWEDFRIFNSEIQEASGNELASAYAKLGEDINIYDLFSVASDNFSEESMRENSRHYLKTRDYAQRAKAQGYDGVIFNNIVDNGGYSNGDEGASTVAIALDSNQIKSVANESPSSDPDIRYSLSGEISDEQNSRGLDTKSEVEFSLSKDTAYMDKAISMNQSAMRIDSNVLAETKALRERIAARMNAIKDRGLVGLPEDIEGNTYIANSSYDGTEENTTICPRSLASEAFVDAVSEYLGRPLTVNEQIYISQDLQGRSLTPECTYCYVATDRKAYRAFLGEYVAQRDAVLQKVKENPNADVSRNGELYKAFLNGRKDTNPMYSRFKMWVDAYKNGRPMIDASHLANINKLMGDINSEFGAEQKPQIVDAMKYAQSASWAKKRVNYVAYNGHILNWKQDRINKLNSHYGLRMYSFSDFHPAFVLENMQMITDASVRGLKMLGYTKDTDFVDIFAPSGMNINVSTFGFEAGGEVFENNLIGAEWEKAKALRNQYPNVGITFVATNDTLVDWALNQDWIDVVIPFHLVRTGREVAKAFNYHDYTSESSDMKTKDWKKGDKKYIAPTEHNNDKATYLAALERNHLKPRFERFLENPNYMKLVNECRQPASVSKPVQPTFDEDAAMVALAKLEANGYYQPVGGNVDRMYEIAGEVAEAMSQELAPTMSLSNMGEQHTSNSLSALRLEAPVAKNATTTTDADKIPDTEYFPDNVVDEQEELESLIAEEAEIRGVMEAYASVGDVEAVNKLIPEHESIRARIRELQQHETDRADSLTDADAPEEIDAPFYMNSENYDPFSGTTLADISRSRRSYSDMNPGARHYFEEAALGFLYDVNNSTHGERWYNDDVYYASGGEQGFGGTSRHTTDDIADLKDTYGYTWDDLRKAAENVVKGDFRSVAAKRVEYLCHKRMMEGYTDVDGRRYNPNQDYISFLNETFANEQRAEGVANLLDNADQYAPDDIAPLNVATPDTFEAPIFESKDPKAVKGQTSLFEDKKSVPSGGKVAQVTTEESETPKRRSKFWAQVKEHILDNGMVFEDYSKETGNREIEAKWNFIRYSRSRAQRLIGNGADGVKALKDIKKTVDKSGKTKEFYNYLYHKHNVDRMSLEYRFVNTPNKAVFGDSVTSEMSQRKVEQYEKQNPEFLNWAEDVYGYMTHLRNLLVENGVISQETADLWEEMYPHYVPIRRKGMDGLNINVPLDTRRTTVNNPIKRATGGNEDILDLFNTMAMRTTQTYRAIARNSFGIELKNQLGTEVNKDAPTVDDVIDGVETDDALLKPGERGMSPTFTVFENGERVEFEITEEMYEAMKPKNEAWQHRNKILSTASSVFRGLTTQYSIPFMATNAIKDAQDVLINSQHPVKTYANFPRAWWQQIWNGKYYQEYVENGGEDNTYFDNETKDFKEDNWFMKGVKFPLNVISTANNFIELTPRLAEYIASREAGRSVEVSMLDAARVTTNFAAGGDVTKWANANGATFLNASVQGAVQQVRNIREAHHKGFMGYMGLAARFVVAGLPAVLLNNMMWDDDEDYEELADYVKQDYYIVGKYDDGKFIRLPKGRTVAVIQDAFEQIQNALTGDDEVDLASFLQLAVNNLAPNNPLDNNIIAPLAQAFTNRTWYGEELVPSRLQDVPAAEQFDEKTDSFSKMLGEKLNISPYKINYVLNQYSGGLGDLILPMMTPRAENGDDSLWGTLTAPLRDKFTTDSVVNSQVVTDFYDTKDAIAVQANSRNATEDDYFRDLYMTTVGYELSDLYKQKREIQSSDLPDSEKYEKSREIQEQIVEIMKNSLNSYNNINVSGVYAEVGDKRYNQDADSGKWYEIKPKNADGSDNWYCQKEQEVTKTLGISYEEYWNNRDEYNYAYDKPGKYALSKAVGGYSSYRSYSDDLYNIKADKDSNGKSISGSRKSKVIEYINGLDADYGEKIILFKSEYNADDTYNYEIIEYLNSREDISYSEMETILKELGFNVDSEGNITW